MCSALDALSPFSSCLPVCIHLRSYSQIFWVAEGLQPGSVPALEAATPAAHQPSSAAADGLV